MKIIGQQPIDQIKQDTPAAVENTGKALAAGTPGKAQLTAGQIFKATVISMGADGTVLLDVEGKQLTAQSLVPLAKNSEIWLEVTKGGSQPQLTTAVIKGVENTTGKALAAGDTGKAQLTAGQIFKATVINMGADGTVLLDVEGKQLTAQSLVPLAKHSELWLEVTKGGSQPQLTTAVTKGAMQDLLKFFIAGSTLPATGAKLSHLLTTLATHLTPETPPDPLPLLTSIAGATSSDKPIPEALKSLVMLLTERSETKNELIDLLSRSNQQKKPLPAELLPLEKLAKSISTHQEINSQPPTPNNPNFFLFPCFFAGESGWGEWLFSRETTEEEKGKEQYTIAFFLEMSRLGPLSLQVTLQESTLQGAFTLQNEKARDHIATQVPELVHILQKQGYQSVSFSCHTHPDSTLHHLKTALQEKIGRQKFSLVDISV